MILLNDFNIALREIAFNSQVKLDAEAYSGEINKQKLEPGLYAYNWNLQLKKDHCFTYYHDPGEEQYHLLLMNFTQQPARIIHHTERRQQYDPRSPWFIYLSGNEQADFMFQSGQSVRFVMILFQQEWFSDQMRITDNEENLGRKIITRLSNHIFGLLSMAQAEIAGQLQRHFTLPPSLLTFRADVYKLINLFIAYENNHHEYLHNATGLMIQFREKLLSYLHSPLPAMEELAKEFHTSVSSLKRHFKAAFGQNIYDFYLASKMELAKKLISEQGLNVTQTAEELGYESVSHFSATFTKHFGLHPGELKKSDNA